MQPNELFSMIRPFINIFVENGSYHFYLNGFFTTQGYSTTTLVYCCLHKYPFILIREINSTISSSQKGVQHETRVTKH